MSDPEAFRAPDNPYGGPPPTTSPGAQPQYPTAGQPSPYGYPPAQPGSYPAPYPQPYSQPYAQSYSQPGPPPWAYGQPGYPPAPYGYPNHPHGYGPTAPQRPGLALAAAVLGYVNAGLLILAGALLLFGASVVGAIEDGFDHDDGGLGAELAIDGFVNFVAAGLLISGAVMLTSRRRNGRTVLAVGNGLVLAAAVYWAFRSGTSSIGFGWTFYTLMFSALAILPLIFVFTGDVNRWLRDDTAEQVPT